MEHVYMYTDICAISTTKDTSLQPVMSYLLLVSIQILASCWDELACTTIKFWVSIISHINIRYDILFWMIYVIHDIAESTYDVMDLINTCIILIFVCLSFAKKPCSFTIWKYQTVLSSPALTGPA